MTTEKTQKTIVVGGGLAGLVAAAALAKAGRDVLLFEQTGHTGGRAITLNQQGFSLNLGPHAVYAGGALNTILREWGVPVSAHSPRVDQAAFLVDGGRTQRFPAGLSGLLRTGALGFGEKIQAAGLLRKLTGSGPLPGGPISVSEWLNQAGARGRSRLLIERLFTLTTYTSDLCALDAHIALSQLRLAFSSGVLYVDGGWTTLIRGLERKALEAGVAIETGAPVQGVGARCVRLADGTTFASAGTVLAAPPDAVRRLTSISLPETTPVCVAALDIGLSSAPPRAAGFGLGLDRPFYFSMHSKSAALAPEGGAVVHAAKYLACGEDGSREELEHLADLLMPGWRDRVAVSRFMPKLVVTHAVANGRRPEVDALNGSGLDGVAIAGDWVGNDAMLADASVRSALRAAEWLTRG